MSMQDPLADMLTRIRNAQKSRHEVVVMPSSKLKVAVAEVLASEGYIVSYKVEGDLKPELTIELKYVRNQPVIEELVRKSKSSLRQYSSASKLPKIKDGLGIAIVSTSKGVMADHKARSSGIGGEILCTVF
jgi:small subunit ribosomal protein S8